ncbi:MAG: indolepyruvate ferredoxin oxidoreductase subunit alpha [Chloroflexota bacterium]|nr:MAG: indolepyruvate ferredoxin oxidoreductase subunit alpha [Chloroflexota bacterium]
MKRLLSGNEAIALGAWEAGVRYAAAYPGTPSTEILPALAQYPGVRAEWAANEKAALDAAAGASFAGARALAAMKHVGVNVASDSLMTLSYTGVGAGLVLVSADDPGAFSSQNEQDNRHYARFGKFPCLEPSDSQEAKDFTRFAFELSERFDTPVMLRSTTRLSHSKSAVEVEMPAEPREPGPLPPFERKPRKYVMIPAHARLRHPEIEARLQALAEYAETCPLNRVEWRDRRIGVIAGGVAYQYAREVFAGFSFLKLGMTYPLPTGVIRDFAAGIETLVVVEELDPFIEEQVRALGLEVIGKELFPPTGELTLARVREGALKAGLPVRGQVQVSGFKSQTEPGTLQPETLELNVPPRPPALCPGCPHRSVYFNLRKLKLLVAGDIGCYAIGVLPPFEEMDMLISMGASIGMAHGAKRAGCPDKIVATIGDSTFFHAGLPELANIIYNRGAACTMILDNGTTAMTGGQDNPATGVTLQGETTQSIDIESVVRAMGVEDLWVVDALDVKGVEQAIREATAIDDRPTVIIVNGACVFTPQFRRRPAVVVDLEVCNGCGLCFRVGCPAILKSEEVDAKTKRPKAEIDPLLCTGCTVCLQVCPRKAMYQTQGKEA